MISYGIPGEIKVLLNHIYEYKKGIRHLILYTLNKCYEPMATDRLKSQGISYIIREAGKETVNIYFGRKECLDAIRLIITKPLNLLTPEEDFILGALLGYDLRLQCERFCSRKEKRYEICRYDHHLLVFTGNRYHLFS